MLANLRVGLVHWRGCVPPSESVKWIPCWLVHWLKKMRTSVEPPIESFYGADFNSGDASRFSGMFSPIICRAEVRCGGGLRINSTWYFDQRFGISLPRWKIDNSLLANAWSSDRQRLGVMVRSVQRRNTDDSFLLLQECIERRNSRSGFGISKEK